MIRYVLIVASALLVMGSNAEAKRTVNSCVDSFFQPCPKNPNFLSGIRSIKVRMHKERTPAPQYVAPDNRAQLLSHPAGCPRSAFCGCGASIEIFGKPVRELYLAANWFKFPRTSPAPNTVGVRRHHVFVLKQHVGGSNWLVYDANSGGHRTRLHVRSISGYTIVQPT